MTLQGCYTAIVTPFRNGQVDYAALKALVAAQLAGGVAGIVPVGTTGESPTLGVSEHLKVIETVIEAVAGRCHVMAGTGANSTAEALELTCAAKDLGADSTLQVTPYYNRPSQEGVYRHFMTIADEVGLPVVLYNIPGRTATEIEIPTVARLAKNPLIVAVKEAGGSVDRVSKTRLACDITILSGDDFLTYPMMALGATGVVSVASNVIPAEVSQLTRLLLAGDYEDARELHFALYNFFTACFIEPNPVPSKAMLHMLGRIADPSVRLPLAPMEKSSKPTLLRALQSVGLEPKAG